MVPKMAKRGMSFKGASAYLLHDKGKSTSERVAWTQGVNLWSDRPEHAWHEMWDTWRERANLKREAGIKATGRDNKAPVLHLSLSWHPDEKPTPEHMQDAARSALKALGLQEHQALLVSHKDEPHPHVHLLINTVHPHTGKTADLKFSKEALSRWAEAYEREHGHIRCEERVKNNARRDELRQERQSSRQQREFAKAAGMRPPPDKPYEPVKDRSQPRDQWFDRQQILDRMKALRAQQAGTQKQERDALWQTHQYERAALERTLEARLDVVATNVREKYRPKWRNLYREQTTEKRYLRKEATNPFERACYVALNSHRLGHGKSLGTREMITLVLSPDRLMKRVEAVHERERRTLARTSKSEHQSLNDRAWLSHRATWNHAVERQANERAALRSHHTTERTNNDFARAKADLAAEQAKAAQAAAGFARAQEHPSSDSWRDSPASAAERMRREIEEMQKRWGPDTGRQR